jgi:hypothetical protein
VPDEPCGSMPRGVAALAKWGCDPMSSQPSLDEALNAYETPNFPPPRSATSRLAEAVHEAVGRAGGRPAAVGDSLHADYGR